MDYRITVIMNSVFRGERYQSRPPTLHHLFRMRLNRFLASAGLGSRRSVEELITTGQVRVNGQVVTDLATKVEPTDAVKVGSRLVHTQQTLTAVLNKPRGYVCTASDELD